jgi:glycosyltransferase involved in cell wall biosynthesis
LIRVGFLINFSDRLLGSLNYFRNLLEAIYSLDERKIEPVIFTGHNGDLKLLRDFPATEIIKTRLLNRKSPTWLFHKMSQVVLPRDIMMENLLRKHHVSVLSHSGSLGRYSRIQTIGWIPDFQHRHLPGLFSKMELFQRDKMHCELCENCSSIVVSSYDALNDLRSFHPGCAEKAHVLQFVAGPIHAADQPSIEFLEKKYDIAGPYFHLPNQFWIHKNHQVVIEALNILRNRGVKTLVIMTGKTSDHRQPEYFSNLLAKVHKYELSDCARFLGVIPYSDLIALMKNSLAVINPSLFEGWSSSVEEAKSLGKRVILSDIPIHREQEPAAGIYFEPSDANGLADIMEQIMQNPISDEEQRILGAAMDALLPRKLSFAENYQKIVLNLF